MTRERHGATHSLEYAAWIDMRARCTNPDHPSWSDYGGRGIKVCTEWSVSFSAFAAHMGPRPAGMSLDRADNNGNYEPGNCRWATPQTQVLNQRVRKDNATGVRGVHWNPKRKIYQVHLCRNGVNKTLGARIDFFEAVCLRKSAENRFVSPTR